MVIRKTFPKKFWKSRSESNGIKWGVMPLPRKKFPIEIETETVAMILIKQSRLEIDF